MDQNQTSLPGRIQDDDPLEASGSIENSDTKPESKASRNENAGPESSRASSYREISASPVLGELLTIVQSLPDSSQRNRLELEVGKIIEFFSKERYTDGQKPEPQDGGMEDDKGNIDEPLSALAKAISTDINVQTEFERQVRMVISKTKYHENENNPPPVPERKFRPRKDSIEEFLLNVWGEWNDRGLLSRRILQIHDRKAHRAVVNFLSNGDKFIDGLNVLTQKEETDQWLEHGIFVADETSRAANAIQTRKHNS